VDGVGGNRLKSPTPMGGMRVEVGGGWTKGHSMLISRKKKSCIKKKKGSFMKFFEGFYLLPQFKNKKGG